MATKHFLCTAATIAVLSTVMTTPAYSNNPLLPTNNTVLYTGRYDLQNLNENKAIKGEIKTLIKYFKNRATYDAIDVTKDFEEAFGEPAPKSPDIQEIKDVGKFILFNTLYMNPLLGEVFRNFTSPSTSGVAAKVGIDATYPNTSQFAPTPTAQIVLNNLNTSIDEKNCYSGNCVSQLQLIENIVGQSYLYQGLGNATPNYGTSPNLVNQLNYDSLVAPLQYKTNSGAGDNSFGSPFGGGSQNTGLNAANEIDNANNFIRYASGSLNPKLLPTIEAFRKEIATLQNKNADEDAKSAAKATVLKFIAQLRTYAARSSIGTGNLNNILARRMPNQANNKSQLQAEYEMASRRLFNAADGKNTWHDNIEKAQTITLLREMNYTLAEINYQLYLNRRIQELSLAAISMIQLQSLELDRDTGEGLSDAGATTDFKLDAPTPTF